MRDSDKTCLVRLLLLAASASSVAAAFLAIIICFNNGWFCWGPLIFLVFMVFAGFFLFSVFRSPHSQPNQTSP